MTKESKVPVVLFAIIGSFSASTVAWSQGFGVGGKVLLGAKPETTAIVRKLPPVVDLAGTSVKIVISKVGSVPPELVDIAQTKLRADLLKDRARNIRLDDANPQTELRCKFTSFELVEQAQKKDVGNATESYKVIIGNMEASVEIYDMANHRALDSENLKSNYEKWFLIGSVENKSGGFHLPTRGHKTEKADRLPTLTERYQAVVGEMTRQVAGRLVPVDERVDVPLPLKKLKDLSQLAQREQWARLNEEAEKMEPLPKADDDAYRLYLLALANEAQGYKAKDLNTAQDFLLKASNYYEKARSGNKGEQKFSEPDIRARESVERYEQIKLIQKKVVSPSQPPPAPAPAPAPHQTATVVPAKTPEPPPAPKVEYNNDYIIELKKAGMPSDFIVQEVQNAKDPKFDVAPAGILALGRAGVPSEVITAMRTKMQGGAPPPAQPRQAPPAKKVVQPKPTAQSNQPAVNNIPAAK
jgi:hypothetical protein